MRIVFSLIAILLQFQLITITYEYSKKSNRFKFESIVIMATGTVCIMAATLF